MSWTRWFSRGQSDGPRPSVGDINFDPRGLIRQSKTPDSIEWRDFDTDRVVLNIDRTPSAAVGSMSIEKWRDRYRRAAAERNGGIVSVDFGRSNGIPITKAIAKFHDMPGYQYEGTVAIAFREALCEITLVAREHGMTGTREAVVTGLLLSTGVLAIPKVVPPAVSASLEGWCRDPYDASYAGPNQLTLSDDDRIDELLPAHPLSKVRQWLGTVERGLIVAPDLHQEIVELAPEPAAGDVAWGRIPPHALGLLYMQAGRFDAAEPLVMESIPIRDGEPLADDAAHGRRLNLLGVIREMLGRPDDALWAFARAERVFLSALGSEHADTTRARANMARIYAGLGRAAEAEPLLADVVPRLEAANTEDELAVALNAFGLVRQAQTRHGEALTYFERALAIFEKQHGPEFRDCADVLQNLAWSVEFLGDAKRARQARARAEKIRRA